MKKGNVGNPWVRCGVKGQWTVSLEGGRVNHEVVLGCQRWESYEVLKQEREWSDLVLGKNPGEKIFIQAKLSGMFS